MIKYLSYFLLITTLLQEGIAQTNVDFEQFHVGGEKSMRSGLALHPNGKLVAIAGVQGAPLFLYDWKKNKIVKKLDAGNWYAGSKVSYSKSGTYLLLQQTFYIDYKPNKDREVDFEIVNSSTGKIVKKFNNVHDVKVAANEKFCIVLNHHEINFYALPSGNKIKGLKVNEATNSLAISPDGKYIAISHHPTIEQVKNAPTIRNDKKAKKAIKPAFKYRQMVSLYDANTLKKVKTINELYDIIYRLQFSNDGHQLFCFSIPHTKMQTSTAGRQGYIYTIKMPLGKPQRTAFVSLAAYEPDFIENETKTLFGVVSFDIAPQINIHDYKTGKMLYRFDTRQRLWEGIKKGMYGDSRASFVFLPDTSILLITGNQTIRWKPKSN